MGWTKEQETAIKLREKNILVAAAAGSGKTAVLVERVKQLILNGEAGIDEMLVVTFTNAAASEMKEKIVDAIRDTMAKAEQGSDMEYLMHQLNLIYSSNISTFHSFALEVIRRYFYVVDVDPGFKVCDEAQGKILQNDAIDEVFAEKLAAGDAAFTEFLDCYSGAKSFKGIKEELLAFYQRLRSVPEPLNALRESAAGLSATKEALGAARAFRAMVSDIDELFADALKACVAAEKLLLDHRLPHLAGKVMKDRQSLAAMAQHLQACKRAIPAQAGAAAVVPATAPVSVPAPAPAPATATADGSGSATELATAPADGSSSAPAPEPADGSGSATELATAPAPAAVAAFETFAKLLKVYKSERMAATKEEKEGYALIKDKCAFFRDAYNKKLKKIIELYCYQSLDDFVKEQQMTAQKAETLCELMELFDEKYRELKKDKGVIDFGDIEHYALQILDNPEIAEEYREKFKYIFIDEYQDSNIIQENLISKIARANNLFMVGDIKQSIYKFRLAEPEIFQGKYALYKYHGGEDSTAIDLARNFRSKRHIIEDTNAQFEAIMKDYDEDAKLVQGVTGTPKELEFESSIHIVETDMTDIEDDEILELQKSELEAEAVSREIQKLISEKTKIHDTKQGCIRTLEYKDIVILMRAARGTADAYKKVFAQKNLPIYAEENDGYFDTTEIEVFLNLLKIIDNRRQDIALISALYSPVFNFSARELAEIRINSSERGVSFFDALVRMAEKAGTVSATDAGSALSDKCAKALERLNAWKQREQIMTLPDFIWYLMEDTGFYIYAGAMPGGKQRQANLRALMDKAETFSETGSGIYSFLRYIDILKQKKVETGQISIVGEGENVVRIMTIHKSKGLDFPVVIVAGLGKNFNRKADSSQISFHKDIGLGMRLVNPQEGYKKKTLTQQIIERQVLTESAEEEVRILYVAYTRAIDRLMLVGTVKNWQEAKEKYQTVADLELAGRKPRETMSPLNAVTFLDLICPVMAGKLKCIIHKPSQIQQQKEIAENGQANLRQIIEKARCATVRPEIAQRLSYRYPHQEELKLKSKYSVTELNRSEAKKVFHVEAREELISQESRTENRLAAAEIGSLVHLFLEHFDFASLHLHGHGHSASKEYIETAITATMEKLVKDEYITEDESKAIDKRSLQNFMTSDLAGRMAEAASRGALYRETPFTLKTTKDGYDILVQGIIDCFFEEIAQDGSKKYILIDYKNSSAKALLGKTAEETDDKRIKDLYREQIGLYCRALEKIKGIPVSEKYIYLIRGERAISI